MPATRAAILEAAARELARTGDAESLTLRGVAREVGVATSSLYRYFDGLRALVDEVVAAWFGQLKDAMTAAADVAGAQAEPRIRARAHAYVRFGEDRPGHYLVMFAPRLLLDPGPVPRADAIRRVFDALVPELRLALDAVDGPGGEREARMAALQLWTVLHGAVTLRLLQLPSADRVHQVDDLVDRVLRRPAGSA
jgi:AcrR family transcriptional regulator